MSIREEIINWLKSHCPTRVSDFQQFVRYISDNNCTEVQGKLLIVPPDSILNAESAVVGLIGTFVYQGVFTAVNSNGEKIIFTEVFGCRTGSSRGFSDSYQRSSGEQSGSNSVEARLLELKELIPSLNILLAD